MSESFSARQLLLPLVPLYRAGLGWRELRLRFGMEAVRRLRCSVISVGNLSTGGSGKTPLTIALARLLSDRGFGVDVLSRGYGRRSEAAARVDPHGSAEEFGDEPILIARESGVPVYVARQRYEAGVLAEASLEKIVHLLDDGFQHRQLARDVDILLLDRQDWRGGLLPAGNLREPLRAARRADIIAIPADDLALEAELRSWGWNGPVWRLRRIMEIPAVNGPIAAFCGIARPEQFFAGLEAAGIQVKGRAAFRDHHSYSKGDLERLVSVARAGGATALITTDKDLVRLGALVAATPEALPIKSIGLRVEIEEQEDAVEWIYNKIK